MFKSILQNLSNVRPGNNPLKKGQKLDKNKLWTPSRMIIWGFNIIAGYTFLIGLGKTFNGVGNFLPLIFIFSSIIAFGSGLAFGKLSSHYNCNGGTLVYARHAYGKTVGGFFGLYQLLQMPFLTASIPVTTTWLFLASNWKIGGTPVSSLWWIFVLAFIFLLLLSLVPRFGFTSNRISLLILWALKWFIVIISVVFALIRVKYFGHNIGHNGYHPSRVNYFDIIGTIVTFFFAFGGFEAVAAQTADIQKGKSKILTILLTMIVMVCVFYLFYYFLILGALGADPDGNNVSLIGQDGHNFANPINMLIGIVLKGNARTIKITEILTGAGATILLIISVLTQIAGKASSRLQSGWGNTRIVAAYAESGYLPKAFAFTNKYQKALNAFWLDYAILVVLGIVFTVIGIGRGVNGQYLIFGALDIVSYISFMQYFGVTLAAIIISYKDKTFKLNIFEKLFFGIIASIIFVLLVSYTVNGFILFAHYVNHTPYRGKELDNQSITIMIDVIMITFIFVIAILLLLIGYILRWDQDDKGNDELDKEIDEIIGHDELSTFKGF